MTSNCPLKWQPLTEGGEETRIRLKIHLVTSAATDFRAMFVSWMNDSGFWVVGRLSGFTEKGTLKGWTMVVTVNSIVGLLTCLLLKVVLPFKPH